MYRLAAAVLASLAPSALGHAWLVEPPSRNARGDTRNGYTPQSGNGGGVCGDGGQWPSASNYLGGANAGPQRTYTAGQVVEFEVKFTAHHRGHMELHICDKHLGPLTPDPEGPNGCLRKWTLERVSPQDVYRDCQVNDKRDDCQPLDTRYPERWYLSPGTGSHKMHFRIPQGLQCESCTLQWRWWTANSCVPGEDYGCYFDEMRRLGWAHWCGNFCGTCSKSALLQSNVSRGLSSRREGCGEEFRNCADITVLASGAPGPFPTPSPSPSPVPSPVPVTTAAPTPAPAGSCVLNTDCVANAWCNDATYVEWCPRHGSLECPSPQCVVSGEGPSPTPAPRPPVPESTTPESEPEPESTTTTMAAPAPTAAVECMPIGKCGAEAWCDQTGYAAYCSAHSGAGFQCPPVFCKLESRPAPMPAPTSAPAPAPTPAPTPVPTTEQDSEPENVCLPTSLAYSLYCDDQDAKGSCPSPWCEMRIVALQTSKAREARSKRHSFLGTVLIQDGASLERSMGFSKVIHEEM